MNMIPILWAVLICGCCTSPAVKKQGPEYLLCETKFVSLAIVGAKE